MVASNRAATPRDQTLGMAGHLTLGEKRRHLETWQRLRGQYDDFTRPGTPDPDIYELVSRINDLQGVVTVQSCAGHRADEPKADGMNPRPAILWLRLSASMYRAFVARASELANDPLVEDVTIRYGREPLGPVAEIIFVGQERGRLHQSGETVLSFLTSLSD